MLLAALFLAYGPPADAARRRSSKKSPHVELEARAVVERAPVKKRHRNGREFEELDVRIESFEREPDPRAGDDPQLPVDTRGQVHVAHDLTCGGSWVNLARGDRVELKGEYVHPTGDERDLIHFTHPANGACGRAGGHADGWLRRSP